jgi:dihydroxyacetone kinase-like protein
VAGMIFAFKTAGAAAAQGRSLSDVQQVAARAAERTRSIGVALSPCLIPGAAAPGFSVPEGGIEIGMGIHGEPGVERSAMRSADEVARAMVERVLDDRGSGAGGRVALLVNSLGATPLEELLIVHRAVQRLLDAAGVQVVARLVGHYATSMEMAGCSVSLLDVDDELASLLAAPTDCPFWPRWLR